MARNFRPVLSALALAFVLLYSSSAVRASAKESKDEAAAEFADNVLEVADLIHREYVVEISNGELVEEAIRGLSWRVGWELPEDMDDSVTGIRGMKDKDLRSLLIEVRKKI
ncbi:MAG: hypothetical protein JO112_18165, partial [Planctomycetes bacterium]|nr:hypothetical protein [Planctomycetota bacterium]